MPHDPLPTTDAAWRARLTAEQYAVLRRQATEPPFTGIYDDHFEDGVYRCAGCGAELFLSADKFDSGCGWPAFAAPAGEEALAEKIDHSHGMRRVEVTCARCQGHLGHVFPDGPTETGMRYCINSVAISFEAAEEEPDQK